MNSFPDAAHLRITTELSINSALNARTARSFHACSWLDWTYQGSHQGKPSSPFSAFLHLQCCPFSLGGRFFDWIPQPLKYFVNMNVFSSHHNSLSLGKPSFKINKITIIKRMIKIALSGDCLEVAAMENDASKTHLYMWIKWKFEFYWLSSFSLFKIQHIFASFFSNNDDGLAVL